MKSRLSSYFEADRARIEVIPMIDIMMFLLVFFIMISVDTIAGSGIALQLPGSRTTQAIKDVRLTIGVRKDGAMFVKGKAVSAQDLRAQLQAAKAEGKVDVGIAGDREVPLQKLVDVMDLVRGEGITAVGLATERAGTAADGAAGAR